MSGLCGIHHHFNGTCRMCRSALPLIPIPSDDISYNLQNRLRDQQALDLRSVAALLRALQTPDINGLPRVELRRYFDQVQALADALKQAAEA